jgi:hypothetical protein
MANFLPLAFFDTLELAGSLRTRWGQFKQEQHGHRILRIRGHAKDSDPAEDRFGRYAGAKGWVELDNTLSEIEGKAALFLPPGIEYGLLYLEMVDAGGAAAWRGETSDYFTRWSRMILPLRTNPATLMAYGVETSSPGLGWLTIVSPRLPRAALNMGEWPCVWLTIDFKRQSAEKDH